MNILIGFLTVIHVLVAVFMIILVLMQKSKDQGVGAAFGAGVTDTVFGAGTTTALVRMTIYCACIFLATSLILAVLHARGLGGQHESLMQKALETPPARAPVSQPPTTPLDETPIIPAAKSPANTPAMPAPAQPAPAAPAKPAAPAQPEAPQPEPPK